MKKTVGKQHPKNQLSFMNSTRRQILLNNDFANSTDVTNINTQLSQVEQDIQNNTTSIASLNSDVSNLQNQVNQNTSAIQTLNQYQHIEARPNHPTNFQTLELFYDLDTNQIYCIPGISPSTGYNPPGSYIAWWRFDELQDTIVENDGNYNLEINGTIDLLEGPWDYCISLASGPGNYLEFPGTLVGFPWEITTIAFFIKKGGVFTLGCGTQWSESTRRLWVRYDIPGETAENELKIRWGQGDIGQDFSVLNLTDQWIHVIIQTDGDGNQYRVYINNEDKGITGDSYNKRVGLEIKYMGALVLGSSYEGMLTTVDEVVLYDFDLNESQRAQLVKFP